MVAAETVHKTPSSEVEEATGVPKAAARAEEEKKEEEPLPVASSEPTALEESMIEPMPRTTSTPAEDEFEALTDRMEQDPMTAEADDDDEGAKPGNKQQRKGGLRAYLASLASRNKAKKEYLAKLKEQNETKKKLLQQKKAVHAPPPAAADEEPSVDTDAAVNTAPAPEEEKAARAAAKTPAGGSLAFVEQKADPTPVNVETVASRSVSESSSAKEDNQEEEEQDSDDRDIEQKQQSYPKQQHEEETVEIVDSAAFSKKEQQEEQAVSEAEMAKVESMAQAHAGWTCCAW